MALIRLSGLLITDSQASFLYSQISINILYVVILALSPWVLGISGVVSVELQ